MSDESEVLKMVARKLEGAHIPYMITGSVASSFYAMPRMTRDIDIVAEIKREDVERLVEIFKDDFYIDRDAVLEAISKQRMFNAVNNQYVVKTDFIIRKDSPYRKVEFERRRQIVWDGIGMWIVSPEDLVLSKLLWARDGFSEMQMGDVKGLLSFVKGLDISYIEKWVESLGLQEIYRRVST